MRAPQLILKKYKVDYGNIDKSRVDDTSMHHLYYPHCQRFFVIETEFTKSGYWFPLSDMKRGDYMELFLEEEVVACRLAIRREYTRSPDALYTIRMDVASENRDLGNWICRRLA